MSLNIPEDRLRVLVLLALGMRTPKEVAELTAYSENTVGPMLAPGGPIGSDLYRNYPAKVVRDRLSLLGIDRLAARLGIEEEAIERALSSHNSQGMVLRFLIWSLEQAREEPINLTPGGSVRSYLLRRFGLDAQILHGDGQLAFKKSSFPRVVVQWSDSPWLPLCEGPPNLNNKLVSDAMMALGWEAFANSLLVEHRSVWNGQLVKLVDARLEHVDDPAHATLELELKRTNYVSHLATNYGFHRWPTLKVEVSANRRREILRRLTNLRGREARRKTPGNPNLPPSDLIARLRSKDFDHIGDDAIQETQQRLSTERADLRNTRDSLLSNCLSVNVAYVTSDNYLVIQQRLKERVGHGTVDWQTSAAGFIALPRDRSDPPTDLAPSIWKAIEHETHEELNPTGYVPDQVSILGLVREARNYEVGLVGLGRLDARAIELRAAVKEYDRKTGRLSSVASVVQPGLDQGQEVKDYVIVPFEPEWVFRFVRDHGSRAGGRRRRTPWENVMPLGALSWLFSLAYRHNGDWDLLTRTWRDVWDEK